MVPADLRLADVVLFRTKSPYAWIIRVITAPNNANAPNHVAIVTRIDIDKKVYLTEATFRGVHETSLSNYIELEESNRCKITYWRIKDEFMPTDLEARRQLLAKRIKWIRECHGTPYDFSGVFGLGLRLILRKTPLIGKIPRISDWITNKLNSKIAFFCSELESRGWNLLGLTHLRGSHHIPEYEQKLMQEIPFWKDNIIPSNYITPADCAKNGLLGQLT